MGKILAACFSFLIPFLARPQYYFFNDDYYDSDLCWEAGVSAGGINCLTDLGGKRGPGSAFIKDVNWRYTKISGSIFTVLSYRGYLAAKAELFFGQVTAADSILKKDRSEAYGRYLRNLHFRSGIVETSVLFEVHPLMINDQNFLRVSPFIVAGVGYFSFNPQAKLNDTWINLSMLHTEGQGFAEYPGRKAYRLTQLNIPAGIGIRYQHSPLYTLRVEMMYRKLWTDYLDDVSKTYINPAHFYQHYNPQLGRLAARMADRRFGSGSGDPSTGAIRGNPENNDAYFSLMAKISVALGRQKRR